MKKLFAFIAAAVFATSAFAAVETVDGIEWHYEIVDGEANVTTNGIGYYVPAIDRTTSGAITVPSTLGGAPVTTIGKYAFYGCQNITGITIPSTVKTIATKAFYLCDELQDFTIPSSVTTFGGSVFENCDALVSMTIPASVTNITGGLFMRCDNLESVTIDGPIKVLPARMYYWCTKLSHAPIPNTVTNIDEFAFWNCAITSMTIPESVTVIGASAFENCHKLESINIPAGVTRIGESAFYKCELLAGHLTIPNGVTAIEPSTFRMCEKLEGVTIPSGVTSIGHYAFADCENIVDLAIPASVTNIEMYAFDGCEKLASVTIPSGVTCIEKHAFANCKAITEIVIPGGVTEIGEYAFYQCTNLVSATIPSSVVYIGAGAFDNSILGTVRVAEGDVDRVKGLIADSGYDVSKITFVEFWAGNLATLTSSVTAWDGLVLYGELAGKYKVSIADGATVTISNAVINGVDGNIYQYAGLTCLGDATIVLVGNNNITGFYSGYPGIYVPAGKTLTIKGAGFLRAASNAAAAGIGGGNKATSCGNIVIESGTIEAVGNGASGPGIGGSTCGDITIRGGTVTATGGTKAAGIGSANMGTCGKITITGGTVNATGGKNSAGIGGGCECGGGGDIYIGSGITRVAATSGESYNVPIGAGNWGYLDGTFTCASGVTKTEDGNTWIFEGGLSGFAAWAAEKGLAGDDAEWDAKPAMWGGSWANAFVYTYGEGLADGSVVLMTISFDANGKPVITTAPVVEGHTDFTAAVVGSETVDDWSSPVTLEQSGDNWTLPAGESANFFRVRMEE